MTELRELIALRMFSDADAIAVEHGDNPIRWEDYQHQDWYYRRADSAIGAIEASGRVTVDRARFERLRIAAYTFKECGGLANLPQTYEEAGLQPGDLDPLP